MPIYEYKCELCGSIFEHLQKVSDNNLEICSICNKKGKVTRLISSSGFRLKGTGWYETDFKNNKKQPEKKQENAVSTKKN